MVGFVHTIVIAQVAHKRAQPKVHAFRYHVYYLSAVVSALNQLARGILSYERFNLLCYKQKDHGDPALSNETWIRGVLAQWGLADVASGQIMLVTMPRILGYAFNPVSFWFCLDQQGQIRAVLSEVNNTFGEKHCYLSYHDDHRPIANDDWMESNKVFHVSPFLTIEGTYRFRFIFNAKRVAIWINHYRDGGEMITTSLIGKHIPLTRWNLIYCALRYPMVTFKVIGLIHWEALRLALKGIRYNRKPPLNIQEITR